MPENREGERTHDGAGPGTAAGAEILVEGELDRPVTAGYAGDLLSWVMARLPEGAAGSR